MKKSGKTTIFVYGVFLSLCPMLTQCTSKRESSGDSHVSSGSQESGEKVILKVNGEPVYLREIEKKLENMKKRFSTLLSESDKLSSAVLVDTAAKNLIQEKALQQEASRRKVFVTESELDSVVTNQISGYSPELLKKLLREKGTTEREWRKEVSNRLLLKKLSRLVVGKSFTVTDKEIQEYYKNNMEQFVFPLKVKALHILVISREKADKLHEALLKGADFRELARTDSVAPEAESGGDLGFFSVGQMPEEFEQVIFSLDVGEISDVIVTPYGFHIFTLIEKKTPVKEKSNMAVKMIRKRLLDRKRDLAYKTWVNMLLDDTEVTYTDNWKSYIFKEKSNE